MIGAPGVLVFAPADLALNLPAEERVGAAAVLDGGDLVVRDTQGRERDEAGGEFPEKVTAFREEMAVHGKFGKPCPVCGTKVQRIVYAENESNYCPRCQTDGKMLSDRSLARLLKGDWPKTIDELEGSELRQELIPKSGK